jgi:hypothetical protein
MAGCVLLGLVAVLPAHAAGRLADVAVINRDTGRPLDIYYHHGEYWVAGEPGAHYAIYLRNRLGERVLAVTSVDGVNVVSGQSAGWDQAGYVLDAWESYQITGWRKSDYQVAAFAFTAAPRSYAARTGRPENVGVIGVAIFREPPLNAALPTPVPQITNRAADAAQRAAASGAQAPVAPELKSVEPFANANANANANAGSPPVRSPALGTAHGEREYSYVAHTHFVRRQWRPDEIVQIRYDSLDNLIAMGVVRPQRYGGLHPNPFPDTDSQAYVPDPPPFGAAVPR